jgi:hypothetical protein
VKGIDVIKRLRRWRKVNPVAEFKWFFYIIGNDLLLNCGCFSLIVFFLFPMVISDNQHRARRLHNVFVDVFNAFIIIRLPFNVKRSRIISKIKTAQKKPLTKNVTNNCCNQSSRSPNTKKADNKDEYDARKVRNSFRVFTNLSNLICDCHIIEVNDIYRLFTAVNHLSWSINPVLFPSTNHFIATDVGQLSWAISNVIVKHSLVDCSFS